MPKPWTIAGFVALLLRVLKVSDTAHKIDVTRALSYLHKHEGLSDTKIVTDALLNAIKTIPNNDSNSNVFIASALQLVQLCGRRDLLFFCEVFAQFLDGDKAVR